MRIASRSSHQDGKHRPIRAAIERLPGRTHEQSRDWSDLAFTRLLVEPLFKEFPERGIKSSLVESCSQLDETRWRITLGGSAHWSNGDRIIARQICEQIRAAHTASAAPACCTAMLRSASSVSPDVVDIETRIPIAHLDRMLANPGLGLRSEDSNVATGSYRLLRQDSESLTLAHLRKGRELQLVYSNLPVGEDPFDSGTVDVSGPMATPPHRWREVSTSPSAKCFPMDIVYILVLPLASSLVWRRHVHLALNRDRICEMQKGSATPCERTSDLWLPEAERNPGVRSSRTPEFRPDGTKLELLYADFPGNVEMARAVANQFLEMFGLIVSVSSVTYDELHSDSPRLAKACRIALMASPWPHPAAMLAPFVYAPDTSTAFRMAFADAIAEDDLAIAAAKAAHAEDELVECGSRYVVLGRVMGCIRSRIGHSWYPPSAWIDYSWLEDSKT